MRDGVPQPTIRHCRSSDWAAVVALLQSAGLPVEDLTSAPGLKIWVLETQGELAGAVALEGTESTGRLLRSLVVATGYQRRGFGQALLARVESEARDEGVERLVLLTETAQHLFHRLGYEVIERAAVPESLRQSAEFRSLCPVSAVCMAKQLNPGVAGRPYNALFLCTGNSARSILAEALLNRWGQGKFRAFSAGSHPTGAVNPYALALLQQVGIPAGRARSKSWDEFAAPNAPQMDFILTVCDNAAGETCPYWPGHPMIAHWGVPDPAAVEGGAPDKQQAFWEAFRTLEARVKLFAALPIGTLEGMLLRQRLTEIGKSSADAPS